MKLATIPGNDTSLAAVAPKKGPESPPPSRATSKEPQRAPSASSPVGISQITRPHLVLRGRDGEWLFPLGHLGGYEVGEGAVTFTFSTHTLVARCGKPSHLLELVRKRNLWDLVAETASPTDPTMVDDAPIKSIELVNTSEAYEFDDN